MIELYKAHIPDMPLLLLYYSVVSGGFLCWTKQDGWHDTGWRSIEEIKEYIEGPHCGKLKISGRLQFLIDTGEAVKIQK